MSREVQLINNPYSQRLSIIIDGKSISEYSNLYQYIDEPFKNWCDVILEAIDRECNGGNFSLTFSSCIEENFVMKVLAKNHYLCQNYSFNPLIRNTPLETRMKNLNDFIRKTKISQYDFQNLHVVFVLPNSLMYLKEDLQSLDIKNAFCKLDIEIIPLQNFSHSRYQSGDVIFTLTDQQPSDEWLKKFSINRNFLIHISDSFLEESSFVEKKGTLFVYHTKQDSIFDTIFHCFLFDPLLQAFRKCLLSIPNEIKSKYATTFENLSSTLDKIIPLVKSNIIELNQSNHIVFKSDIDNRPVPIEDLSYSYSCDGIIHCNGLVVEGMKVGKSTLYIYRVGESIPCSEIAFSVIKRNRIQEIIFDNQNIVVGENTYHRINFRIVPDDADNLDSIFWKSNNPQVASVDANGILKAHSPGSCDIRCFAENVSGVFRCIVKPFLEDIVLEDDSLNIFYGQEQDLKIHLIPGNAIDGGLYISSMDMRIANVVGTKIQAVGVGNTRIIVENENHNVRKSINVTVTEQKKKGWLARLFS